MFRRSQRERKRPDYYGVWIHSVETTNEEPTTAEEALKGPEKLEWKNAMEKEIQSMHQNEVWDLVELPNERKAIGCRWVFKKKIGAGGEIERYKARLVAQGCSQKYGLDYDETFCPVIRFESVRTVIAIAAQNSLQLHQMDFTSAFLNGDLKDEIYMKQPDGFVESGKEQLVCKLKRSLYGLKQSPRCWNSSLDNQLRLMKFRQSHNDPCIYVTDAQTGGVEFVLGVYVDDVILAGRNEDHIKEVKRILAEKFDLKDLGELKYFLGVSVHIRREKEEVWIGQPLYIESILKKFGMDMAKAISTPVDACTKLQKATPQCERVDPVLYQSAVGSLLYISTNISSDITMLSIVLLVFVQIHQKNTG
jgi:hypothetical protein